MKKIITNAAAVIAATALLSSCYPQKIVVGKGAQGNQKSTKWNHYLIYGLVPVGVSDTKKMSDGADNYDLHTRHTFLNGVVGGFTLGIYTPTTTTLTK